MTMNGLLLWPGVLVVVVVGALWVVRARLAVLVLCRMLNCHHFSRPWSICDARSTTATLWRECHRCGRLQRWAERTGGWFTQI